MKALFHVSVGVTARIRAEMTAQKLRYSELAEKLGWSYPRLYRVLNDYAPLYVDDLLEIAGALAVPVETLLREAEKTEGRDTT